MSTSLKQCVIETKRSGFLIAADPKRRAAKCRDCSVHTDGTAGKAFPAPSTLKALLSRVPGWSREFPVYAYIVTTIKTTADYRLIQKGSAPNFDGGRITLCTCKHKDRATFHPAKDQIDPWKNVWVAGLTSKSEDPSRSLAYLMLVERSFANHLELWHALPHNCRRAKSASKSQLGDSFKSKTRAINDPHDPAHYELPIRGHVHSTPKYPDAWHHDVMRWGKRGKAHRLLLGEAAQSYRWQEVRIILKLNAVGNSAHHRLYETLDAFIANLQEFDA